MAEEEAAEIATFGVGPFWGVEAEFTRIFGALRSRRVGYMGGHVAHPTPEDVATNTTGHAEVVELTFDPAAVSFAELLLWFWQLHDPTAVPRDAPLAGHRFRSAIFFHTPEQEEQARAWHDDPQGWLRRVLPSTAVLPPPIEPAAIVTEVAPAQEFWPAPDEQQDRFPRVWLRHFEQGAPFLLRSGPRKPPKGRAAAGLDPVAAPGHGFESYLDHATLCGLLDESDDHVAAAVAALRRSLSARNAQDATEPLPYAAMGVALWLNEVRLLWSWPDNDHVFVTSFRPGNFTARASVHERYQRRMWWRPPAPNGDGGEGMIDLATHPYVPMAFAELSAPPVGPWPRDPEATGRWFECIPAVEVALDVGASSPHRVSWRAGEISLVSHPGAIEDEQVLAALAGRACPCLWLVHMWPPEWIRQGWHQQSVLSRLGERFCQMSVQGTGSDDVPVPWQPDTDLMPHPELEAFPEPSDVHRADWQPTNPEQLAAFRNVMRRLLRLPQALFHRWVIGALAALEHERESLSPSDRLNLSGLTLSPLRAAASRTLWHWCRSDPTISYGHFVFRLLDRDEAPRVEGFVDGDTAHVLCAVPFKWLTHVWARGLAVVDQRLVLGVEGPTDAATLDCVVVAWDQPDSGATPRLATEKTTMHWDGSDWYLAARGR